MRGCYGRCEWWVGWIVRLGVGLGGGSAIQRNAVMCGICYTRRIDVYHAMPICYALLAVVFLSGLPRSACCVVLTVVFDLHENDFVLQCSLVQRQGPKRNVQNGRNSKTKDKWIDTEALCSSLSDHPIRTCGWCHPRGCSSRRIVECNHK